MEAEFSWTVISLIILVIIACVFFLTKHCLIFGSGKHNRNCKEIKSLVVIGSGGHTAEMLRLVETLSQKYYPRLYVMAQNDTTSESKVHAAQSSYGRRDYDIVKVPRSRNVNQSYLTSIFTTIYASYSSAKVIFKFMPDLVLCNGPGICVPICLIALLYNKIFGWGCKVVFIESFCRVESLSLTGRLLIPFVDQFVVQWPELLKIYPKAKYLGRLY